MDKGFGVGIDHLLHKPRDCHDSGDSSYMSPLGSRLGRERGRCMWPSSAVLYHT